MAYQVLMGGGRVFTPEHRFFSCNGKIWEIVLNLARENDWKELGTLPASNSARDWEKFGNFSGDYKPSIPGYWKLITAEDAESLANAVDRVKRKLDSGEIKVELGDAYPKITTDFLSKFSEFLRKGEFDFCWDD